MECSELQSATTKIYSVPNPNVRRCQDVRQEFIRQHEPQLPHAIFQSIAEVEEKGQCCSPGHFRRENNQLYLSENIIKISCSSATRHGFSGDKAGIEREAFFPFSSAFGK